MASYSGRETREGFAMFKCERTMYNEKLWWTQSGFETSKKLKNEFSLKLLQQC
jgi:hypothetical protein